jgi:O-antigen/teichoic acid export membrane protein
MERLSARTRPDSATQAELDEIEEFRGRATGGAAWSGFGYGSQQIVRLAANLVLTRLLLEEYFGLMALVSVVLAGVALFSDFGISASLIQNEREDPGFVDTLWTIETIRGFVMWVVASLLAGPLAGFYEEPILADLIRVASLGFIIDGFKSTKFHMRNRNLEMKSIVALEVTAQACGAAVMIVWASYEPTVWALVAGGLVARTVVTTLSHVGLRGRWNRFHFEKAAALDLYHFGRWILLSTMFMFLFVHADRLIFGKLVSMSALGIYSIGANLAVVPAAVLSHLGGSVIFPMYSRFQRRGEAMAPIFRNVRFPIVIIGGWAMSGIIAGGPTIIRILYDPRYWAAGWMMQIIASGLWFRTLESSNGAALLALGQSRWMAISNVMKLIAMAVLIPIGWKLGEFKGALLGFAASDAVLYLASVVGLVGFGLDDRKTDLKMTMLVAVSSAAAWLIAQGVSRIGWDNVWLQALVIAAVVSAIWGWPLSRLWRRYQDTGHVFFGDEEV